MATIDADVKVLSEQNRSSAEISSMFPLKEVVRPFRVVKTSQVKLKIVAFNIG